MNVKITNPDRASFEHEQPGTGKASIGGSSYTALIPRLHQILADPADGHEFPGMPKVNDFPHAQHTMYWEPAVYLLRVLLGWSDPAKGLRWWFDAGKPADPDSPLDALKSIWDCEQQLDLLATWFWCADRGLSAVEPNYWRSFRQKYPVHSCDYPYRPDFGTNPPTAPGSNELHLGSSLAACEPVPVSGKLFASRTTERTAVLVLDDASGWHFQLVKQGETLPSLGERSWHVDVVVKPIGWMGMFRRSRATGRWFVGKHSVHMRGQ